MPAFPRSALWSKNGAELKLFWNNGTDLDKDAAAKLASLLEKKLTADDAVQIALLNNRELQGFYADLGVAQADLVQAGLLSNPIFDAAIKWPAPGGGRPDLELAAVMNFLDIFYLPLRKRVAAARFEEAKTRVGGLVLDFAVRVRTAFYVHQANEQMLELRQTIVQALSASFDVTQRLHQAGNITELDFARERALLESGKLALRSAEVAVRQSREELNILMGLWGKQTEWQTDRRLPDIPPQPIPSENIEPVALNRSVDLLQRPATIAVRGRAARTEQSNRSDSRIAPGYVGRAHRWRVGSRAGAGVSDSAV